MLKAEVVSARQETCRGCPHVIKFGFPHEGRVHSCDLLYDENKPQRDPSHYLFTLTHTPEFACPDNRFGAATDEDFRRKQDPPMQRETSFQQLWREIHDATRHWDERFVLSILARLPCGECRREFVAYGRENPPPLGDDRACWAWGVQLHNSVNQRLNKERPVWTEQEAWQRWVNGLGY